MILERPAEGEFRFPVISGFGESMPRASREMRMNSYVQFMKEIELAQPGADDHVSEVDLSDAADLRTTLTGLGPAAGGASPVLVHFGDSDFGNRYRMLSENIGQWRASAGSVDSVDLRFARQVVVNPETNPVVAAPAHSAPAQAKAASKRK
jgi:cell division protein FtsQ